MSNIAGSLIGATIGGLREDVFGVQPVFFITGAQLLVAFIIIVLKV